MKTERQRYLDREVTHDDYYLGIAREIGVSFANSPKLPRIVHALERGDEHLNTIPLGEWDANAATLQAYQGPRLRAAFKARGDTVALGGLVCLLKAAAKDAGLAALAKARGDT